MGAPKLYLTPEAKRESRRLNQLRHRAKVGNVHTHKYEKTPQGFLMRLYRNMQSRTSGIQKKKAHLYEGKSLLSRDEFYKWATEDTTFKSMFDTWKLAGYDRKLTPTVNRKDSAVGYELDNMEWLTHSENSRLGANAKRKIQVKSPDD